MKQSIVVRINFRLWVALAAFSFLVAAGPEAFAHFLFIKLGTPAKAQRTIEVFFGLSTEEGDPQFIEKIAGTQLWLRSADGKKVPIKLEQQFDRLVGTAPAREATVIEGRCEYGVLKREKPFLLRYYPRTLAGDPKVLNQIESSGELPVEVTARFKGTEIELTARSHGKPIPREEIYVVDADLESAELPADENGVAVWKPPAAGHYTIYIGRETEQAGELDGVSYESIREFGTLGIKWPLDPQDMGELKQTSQPQPSEAGARSSEKSPSSDRRTFFVEHFDDAQLLSRGMYGGRDFVISSQDPYSGDGCIEFSWKKGETQSSPSSGFRRLFPPSDRVYLRFYLKLSPNWGWSGRPYHPHLINFLTTENGKYHGPASSHLTLYVEPVNGKLRLAATDMQNQDAPHGTTQGPLRGGYNGKMYDSEAELFDDAEWHLVEAMFQLNTLDLENDRPNADGKLRGWFDGRLVIQRDDVIFRSPDFPEMKINQFLLLPYFGRGLLPHEQTLWIDELAVGTEPLRPRHQNTPTEVEPKHSER